MCSLFCNCAQLGSFQTAKVLPKKQSSLGVAAIGYGVNEAISTSDIGVGVVPHVEISSRFGVGNKLDFGARLSSSINLLLDAKYQYAGNSDSKFAAAIGAGMELQATNVNDVFVYRVHLPLYFSIHPNTSDALYATPRMVFQSVSDDTNSYFWGASLGYQRQFNNNLRGMIEASYYKPTMAGSNLSGTNLYQFGVGIQRIFGAQ